MLLIGACVAAQWNVDGNRRVDLRIYLRAVSSADSGHLYDYGTRALNFLYPPFAAVVLRPLGWVGEQAATRVWLVVSIALGLVAVAAVVRRAGGVRAPAGPMVWVVAAASLWSVPTFLTFRMGQINPLIALLVCLDVVAMSRRSRWGGIATGIAAALKVTPLVLVAALLLAPSRRRDGVRALAAFATSGLAAAVIMPSETVRFWTKVVFEASDIGGARDPFNASLYSLTGLLTSSAALQRVLWFIAATALVVAIAVRLRRRFEDDVVGAVVVVMNLAAVVSPLSWVHHHWFATIAALLWVLRATRPWQWVVVGLGAIALVDPLALGEESMLRTALLVAFAVATVLALPDPAADPAPEASPADHTDFLPDLPIPQDVACDREERTSHA